MKQIFDILGPPPTFPFCAVVIYGAPLRNYYGKLLLVRDSVVGRLI